VAELLASFGWEVRLPPKTRANADILASSADVSGLETTWLVDAKRYSQGRKVGVAEARHLSEAREQLGLSNAMVATTSSLTKQARDYIASQYDLHLSDFERLVQWLRAYRPSPEGRLYLENRTFHSCFISYSQADEQFATHLNEL
jgi:restriction endonuclease Mrr